MKLFYVILGCIGLGLGAVPDCTRIIWKALCADEA